MGAEGFLIALAVILVVFAFWGTQLLDTLSKINETALQKQSDQQTLTQAKSSQQVCTLKVSFQPAWQKSVLFQAPQIQLTNGAYSVSWINCASSVVTNSLLPLNFFDRFNSFRLLTLGDSPVNYHFHSVLNADDGTHLNAVLPDVTITVPNGIAQTSYSFNLSYTFLHVPRQHYTLQLSSAEIGINQQNAGNIYNQNINP